MKIMKCSVVLILIFINSYAKGLEPLPETALRKSNIPTQFCTQPRDCINSLAHMIYNNWEPSSDYSESDFQIVIQIFLDDELIIDSYEIVASSGDKQFDKDVIDAISPFVGNVVFKGDFSNQAKEKMKTLMIQFSSRD